MDTRLKNLRFWGADVKDGMDRLYADEPFFLDCLRTFERDGNFEKLDLAMLAGNYEDAFVASHTLKGVAGNLSLGPLYDALCALTEKLRSREYRNVGPLYAAVKREAAAFRSIMQEGG